MMSLPTRSPRPSFAIGILAAALIGWLWSAGLALSQVPAAGSLDTTFGGTGMVLNEPQSYGINVADLKVTAVGNVLLLDSGAGLVSYSKVRLTCFTPAGVLDTSFHSTGTLDIVKSSNVPTYPSTVVPLPDGKILVGCNSNTGPFVRKYTLSGSVDTSFGSAGDKLLGQDNYLDDVALLSNGRILAVYHKYVQVAGGSGPEYVRETWVMRLTASGDVDTTFGVNGERKLPAAGNLYGQTLTVLPGDGIQVAAFRADPVPDVQYAYTYVACAARLTAAGAIDTAYGMNSSGIATSPTLPVQSLFKIKAQADGTMLATGSVAGGGVVVMRFTADAFLDITFGNGGVSETSAADINEAGAVLQRADGRIFVAATQGRSVRQKACVLRYKPDGRLDAAFDGDGAVLTATGGAINSGGGPLALQNDGRLLMGGLASSQLYRYASAVARYHPGAMEVNTAPVFSQVPSSLSAVPVGQAASFTAVLDPNTLLPWFVWRKHGTVIQGQNSATLTIANVQLADEDSYTVEASNFAGSVMKGPFTLTVKAPPVAQIQEAPVAAELLGEVLTLHLSLMGRAPFTCQWRLEGQAVGAAHAVNGNTDTLPVTIAPAILRTYTVTVTNADGQMETTAVVVSQRAENPAIKDQTRTLVLPASVAGSIQVTVKGRPPFTYQWQRAGVPFGAPVQQTGATATLAVAASAVLGDTLFSCSITNAAGSISSDPIKVSVLRNPTQRQKSQRLLLRTGDPLSLTTTFYSTYPALGHVWQHNGKNIVGATAATYTVAKAALANAGAYHVTTRTIAGGALSDDATVAVVDSLPRTLVVAAGKTATLTALYAGDGLSFQWQRQQPGSLTQTRYTGAGTRSLLITKTQAGDAGEYTCVVTRTGVAAPVSTGVITLVIESEKPQITAFNFDPAYVARDYHQQVAASHSARFTISSLPPGLKYDVASGVISGKPTVPGKFKVKVTAVNVVGPSVTETHELVVNALSRAVVGAWSGPIADIWTSQDAYGTFTLTVAESGAFTGKGSFGDCDGTLIPFAIAGQMADAGNGNLAGVSKSFVITSNPTLGEYIRHACTLSLTWTEAQGLRGTLHGEASSQEDLDATLVLRRNPWNARTNPATQFAGYHTSELRIPTTPANSSGSGYASFTVTTGGTLTVAGRMPDGSAFTIPTFIDAAGSIWMHVWLYAYQGRLSGDLALSTGVLPSFIDSSVTGSLRWVRPPSAIYIGESANGYYNGIQADVTVHGARYLPPNYNGITGPFMMDANPAMPAVQAKITGGDIANATFNVTLNTRHVTSVPLFTLGDDVKGSAITFNPTTGAFSGTGSLIVYADDVSLKIKSAIPVPVQGLVTRESASNTLGYGAGYFTRTAYEYFYNPDDPEEYWGRVLRRWSGKISITPQ